MLLVVAIKMICTTLAQHLENVNICRSVYITQSNIYDGAFIAKV